MNLRYLLVLSLVLNPVLTPAQEKPAAPGASPDSPPAKDPPARVVVPASTEGKEALSGTWALRNADLAKAVARGLQQSAGSNSVFEVGVVKGEYLATIDLAANKITVEWKEWQMTGTSRNERTGASEIVLSATGRQGYELVSCTDGKSVGTRRWSLKLQKDATSRKLTFRGFEAKSTLKLPDLGNGLWTVYQDRLYLQSRGEVWVFDRRLPEP